VSHFDAKHLLHELLWKMFMKEVELAESPSTLFRGNTFASKIMSHCFKMYGSIYLNNLLRAFFAEMVENGEKEYEVDSFRCTATSLIWYNIVETLLLQTRSRWQRERIDPERGQRCPNGV